MPVALRIFTEPQQGATYDDLLADDTVDIYFDAQVTLAREAGLDPHLGPDCAAPDAHGRVSIMIQSDNARDGLSGVIYLSSRSGAIVSAYLTHGVHGGERCFRGGRAVRTVIRSWVAVTRHR